MHMTVTRKGLNLRPQNITQKVQHKNYESGLKHNAHRLVQHMLQVMWRWQGQIKGYALPVVPMIAARRSDGPVTGTTSQATKT